MMNIPFSKVSLTGSEYENLRNVLKSGWLTTSKVAREFEKSFAEYIGVKYACAVNSCTSALHLALESVGVSEGDQVLVPSLTFTASAEVIRYLGADPVFLDVDNDTGIVSPEGLLTSLEYLPHIKALILVHYGGHPATLTTSDNRGILDICKEREIYLIEDAAHAFPSKINGKYIGSFGDATCFSFYANKTITTGEGGMLVSNNKEIIDRARIMRLHGINQDVWSRYISKYTTWEYDVIAPGYKYNMADINAAIGLAQLKQAEEFRLKREKVADFYMNRLSGIQNLHLPRVTCNRNEHSWHLFPIIIDDRAQCSRNDFIVEMAKRGIGTSVHYKPLHRMTYYREKYLLNPEDFPNTEKIWRGTVSLPIYPSLSNRELVYICRSIKEILID